MTDDRGRYVIPDLPKANYDVWVRGYGLVDSSKVQAAPGKTMNLTAVAGAESARGSGILSGQLLVSLLQVPPKTDFPGTGAKGNGIAEGDDEPAGVHHAAESRRLRSVPSDGQQGHA